MLPEPPPLHVPPEAAAGLAWHPRALWAKYDAWQLARRAKRLFQSIAPQVGRAQGGRPGGVRNGWMPRPCYALLPVHHPITAAARPFSTHATYPTTSHHAMPPARCSRPAGLRATPWSSATSCCPTFRWMTMCGSSCWRPRQVGWGLGWPEEEQTGRWAGQHVPGTLAVLRECTRVCDCTVRGVACAACVRPGGSPWWRPLRA